MAISERESQQIEKANASGNTPIVLILGLWLLPSSWNNWVDYFEEEGYAGLTPYWPDDPETVEEARANPDVLAKKTLKQVADHTAEVIDKLDRKPAVMGHSTGGLLTYMIADRGLSAASVAIDPGPFRGVLPLPLAALRSASPVLRNPFNRGKAITLTLDQFKYGWANALSDEEAKQLYETYHVAAPGVALMQMANANINPWTEAKVDPKNPDRGPLLIIDGEKDHTVPWAIANAAYNRQKHNEAVTEIEKIPNRGHSLTIDGGWREVAQKALDFVKRFRGDDPDPLRVGILLQQANDLIVRGIGPRLRRGSDLDHRGLDRGRRRALEDHRDVVSRRGDEPLELVDEADHRSVAVPPPAVGPRSDHVHGIHDPAHQAGPRQSSVSGPVGPSTGSASGSGTARMLVTASSCSAGSPRRMSHGIPFG
jgi:non-heme chloroperoxidase